MTTEHVPGYLAGATSDPLMIAMAIILVIVVLIAGVMYFKLHAVPEHIAHGKNHTQVQLIAILTILALFTHNNIFWVAALVLAVVEFPDFLSPLKSIAKSLETIAKAAEKTAPDTRKESVAVQQVDTKESH
jgi:hypothetical protein